MRNLLRHSTLAACAALLLTSLVSGQTPSLPPYPPGQGYPLSTDHSPKSEGIRRLIDRAQRLKREADHPVVQEQLGRQRGDLGSYIEEGENGRTLAEYLPAREKIQECARSARDLNNRDEYCHAATRAIALCQAKRIAWVLEQKGVLDQAQRAGYDNRALDTEMYLLSKRELLPCPSGESLEGLTPEQMLQKFKDNDEANFQWRLCDRRMDSFDRMLGAKDFDGAEKELVNITPPCPERRAQAARDRLAAARPAAPKAEPKPDPTPDPKAGAGSALLTPEQIDALKKAGFTDAQIDELMKKALAVAAEEDKDKDKDDAAEKPADEKTAKPAADVKAEQEKAKETETFETKLEATKEPAAVIGLAQAELDAGRPDLYREALREMVVRYPPTDPFTQIALGKLLEFQDKDEAEAKAKAEAEAAKKAPPSSPQQAPNQPQRPISLDQTINGPKVMKKLEECAAEFDATDAAGRMKRYTDTHPGNIEAMRAVIATINDQIAAFDTCSGDARYPEALKQAKAQRDGAITTCRQIASNPAICTVSPWK